jgi:amino acid permease
VLHAVGASVPRRSDRLTFVEAVSLMVGAGVGAGIMAVPFLAARTGVLELLAIVAVALAANCLIHLMLAEVIFRTGRDLQVIELMRLHVFPGRWAWLVWAAFVLLGLAFVAILAAYIAGGSEILTSMTGANGALADGLVYALCAGVVLLGLKGVGVFEKAGTVVLVAAVGIIAAGAFGVPLRLEWAPAGTWTDALALYGMAMYALYTFYTVPQVVKGLAPDRGRAVGAVVTGLAVNALLVTIVALVAMGVPGDVTEVAIVGIAKQVGGWVAIVGSVFIFAALVTSYWSVSLALADVIAERTGIGPRASWLLATLPSLVLLLLGGWRFLEWLRLAGGATALVVVLISVPMYLHARRHGDSTAWSLGRWGSGPMLALVVLAAALMAAGSLLQL